VGTAGLPASLSTAVARTVARVDATGAVDTSTALTDFASGDKPRGAASSDGSSFWLTCGGKAAIGTDGVHYAALGSTTSTQISDTFPDYRQVSIFNGQLYVSSQNPLSIVIGTVGTGLPNTTGQVTTVLPGFVDASGQPEGIFFADLDGTPGLDTLYVADDNAGLQKWSLVSGSWVLNNTIAAPSDSLYGVTGIVNGTTVTLYVTGSGSHNDAGTLYTLTDSSGYNTPLSGTLQTLATASANQSFRGVALAPENPGLVPPNAGVNSCEDTVGAHVKTLALCMAGCEIKQADAALKVKPFDEEACEQGAGKPVSCRAAFNKATSTLLGKPTNLCPFCLDAAAQSNLADAAMTFIEQKTGQIYCAGTVPFGGDDGGFVPPDKNVGKCEDTAVKHLKTLASCVIGCQKKQADAARKGKPPVDTAACEMGTGKPTSCRAAYDKATLALLNTTVKIAGVKTPICPPCLGATTQGSLADAIIKFLNSTKGQIYCGGTTPLPLP